MRQLAEELLGIGGARGGPQILVAGGPVAVAQIVARRGREDDRFLRHHRDTRADVGGIGIDERHPVEQNLSRLRIVEALGELKERRFACARGADDRNGFARADCETEIMERRRIGARRIAELDAAKLERADGRVGECARVRGRRDGRLGVQKLAEPLGGAGGAEQVAIYLGQGAERAGNEAAGEHEGGDGAAGDRARCHALRPVPQQRCDRAEEEADDRRGNDRAQADAALGGREIGFDRGGEAVGLARLLPERLDNLHRAHLFGGSRADVGHPILADARHFLEPPTEEYDRQDDDRNPQQYARRELRREAEQIGDAPDPHHHVAERDRDGRADDLFDDRSVRGHARGDFGRAVFLEKSGGEAEQVALHRLADVGDGAFAEPADEIEAQRSRQRQRNDDGVKQPEMRGDVAAARDEAAVDHFLELPGDCECRERRNAKRDRGDRELQRVAAGIVPHHAQTAELAAGSGFRGGLVGLAGHGVGPSSGVRRAQRRRMRLRLQTP